MSVRVVMMSTMLSRPHATEETRESGADSLARRNVDVSRTSTLSLEVIASSKDWSSSAVRFALLIGSAQSLPVVSMLSVTVGQAVSALALVVSASGVKMGVREELNTESSSR